MNKPVKALLFLFSLSALILSAAILSTLFELPYLTEIVHTFRNANLWADSLLAGFSAFICLCFLILALTALFAPSVSSFMIITSDKGKMQFSRQTIESTVRYSFSHIDGITSSRVKVRLSKHPEKTRIFIRLTLNDASRLTGLSEAVQRSIETALESSLGVRVRSIDVRTASFSPSGGTASTPPPVRSQTQRESEDSAPMPSAVPTVSSDGEPKSPTALSTSLASAPKPAPTSDSELTRNDSKDAFPKESADGTDTREPNGTAANEDSAPSDDKAASSADRSNTAEGQNTEPSPRRSRVI